MANPTAGVLLGFSLLAVAAIVATGVGSDVDADYEPVELGITHTDWTQSLYQTYDWENAAAVERKIYDRIQTGDCYRPVEEPTNLTTVIREHHNLVTQLETLEGTLIFVHSEGISEELISKKSAGFMLVYDGAVRNACVDQLQMQIPSG